MAEWRPLGAPIRLGRAPLPRFEIRDEHSLQIISKRPTDAQHCLKVFPAWTCHNLALVGGMRDLVQVAADAPKLADGALESQQLVLRQRRKRPQVTSRQDGDVRGRRHPSRCRQLKSFQEYGHE